VSESERIARAYEHLEARGGSRWSLGNAGNRMILAERRRVFRRLLEEGAFSPLAVRRILEVGSGTGGELAWLMELGATPAQIIGVDLLADRVAIARREHPEIDFRQGNAEHLELEDAGFDLVMAITIFSSILDRTMAANVASEIVRVMRPGGALLWYDVRYDSVSNPSVKAVSRSRVRDLFPALRGDLRSVTVLPPLARRLGPATRLLYPMLASLPPLRSHLVGLLQKPTG
jgi:ubiquinone/menaquinone biosynthesis C-methylase UbiE